ncbi:MAG: hypothetical protein MN733_00635, partial [Nitrososphaera sp.]|nr:hypothetical protein [Nitrososphaera sp.]
AGRFRGVVGAKRPNVRPYNPASDGAISWRFSTTPAEKFFRRIQFQGFILAHVQGVFAWSMSVVVSNLNG